MNTNWVPKSEVLFQHRHYRSGYTNQQYRQDKTKAGGRRPLTTGNKTRYSGRVNNCAPLMVPVVILICF